jgi:NAD(P)-dependent dehydrogenase (short-subunit alcohol dehydrogenase family)
MSKFRLDGKKALITGGSGGIGKAVAIAMAEAGADIAIIDLKRDEGLQVVDEIKKLGRDAVYYDRDLAVHARISETIKAIAEYFGQIDIAFNNAGIGRPGGIPTLDDRAVQVWDDIMAINLTSVFHCCREEGKYMAPRKQGKIINTASISATVVNHFPEGHFGISTIAYCAAKAGVRQFTKALAIEWAKYNIQVNCISPGYTVTPFTAKLSEEKFKHVLEMQIQTIPIGRRAEAEEMAGGVLFLASDASSYVTGHDLVMDGGYSVW